jgi:D-3-phosphoglycerate dehydrogenase / 2-oxoglutarate reductase
MSAEARPLVVLSEPIHQDGHAFLESEARVAVCQGETEEAMVRAAAEAQGILFILKPACTESLMAACPKLRVVGRHGAGLDTVDMPAATRLGVAVVHAPGANSQSVAEHAMMLMLSCAKQTHRVDRMTRAGEWGPERFRDLVELKGKTLGIIGVGNVGRITARLATAFGMRVLGYDPYVPNDEMQRRGAEPVKSLEALLPQVDVLTCHAPLTPETRAMINARTLGLMRKGAIFVNTSRGPVQDERALFEALTRGRLAAAGLDVFEDEPSSVDNPLFNLENVIVSSHVAGVTAESNRAMAMQVAGEMLRVLRSELPHVLANKELLPRLGHLRPPTR